MNLLDLYLRYQRTRVRRGSGAPTVSFAETLADPKRIAVCLAGDPRLPPLAMPSLRLLRRRFPKTRVLVVGGPSNIALFRRERAADKAIVVRKSKGTALLSEIRRVGQEIAKLEPDLLLVFDSPPRPVLLALAHASGVPLRAGFGAGENAPFLNIEVAPPQGGAYLARSLLRLAGTLTGRFADFLDDTVRWKIPEADARRAERLIHFWQPRADELLVAVEPGRENPELDPDIDKYAAVARLLARAYGARVMIVAMPEERLAAEELESRLASLDPYRAQADDASQAISFLSQADLLVSSNTPLFHHAVGLGVPSVGLFPEDAEEWTVPPSDAAVVLLPIHREITEDQFLTAVETLNRDDEENR